MPSYCSINAALKACLLALAALVVVAAVVIFT